MSRSEGNVPQDIVAIFHASFHPTQGNIIDWSLKVDEGFDLSNVEFSSLPSGLHLIEQDVIYFTKNGHQGVCVFKRRPTSEHGHRGFRLSSLGIILSNSPRPRPWKHVPNLESLVDTIYRNLEDREVLEPTEEDWQPARAFFEERKYRSAAGVGEGVWSGWSTELGGGTDFDSLETSPIIHLPHLLRILGPSSVMLYKHVLGRQRVLIYTTPPVQLACLLCYVAADMCLQDQVDASSLSDTDRPENTIISGEPSMRVKGRSKEGIKVLGLITLSDFGRLQEQESRLGWIACTTDAMFLEKPSCYDLLIDLTTLGSSKFSRPVFYVPRSLEQSGLPRLSVVHFTWSDVKIWTELERILRLDSSRTTCCFPATFASSRSRLGGSTWTNLWRMYEDFCVICASLWLGSWRGAAALSDSLAQNWGSVHLDGEDYISIQKGGESHAVISSAGIENETQSEQEENPSKHNTNPVRPSNALSLWALGGSWTRGDNPSLMDDGDGEVLEEMTRRREMLAMTTLALLHIFHQNTMNLLSRLAMILPTRPFPARTETERPPPTLSYKDLVSLGLGPLSSVDTRFVGWLAEEYSDGTQLVIRRSWRDILGMLVGFG